ncbi:hypothetical protein ACCT09_09630 [Rhizobium ruizarguesonis]
MSQALEDAVAPDIIRETEIEAAALIGKEAFTVADVTVDIGEDFPSLVIEAERTRAAIISLQLDVPQQVENGGRPRAPAAPHRFADAHDIRILAADKRNFWLVHSLA